MRCQIEKIAFELTDIKSAIIDLKIPTLSVLFFIFSCINAFLFFLYFIVCAPFLSQNISTKNFFNIFLVFSPLFVLLWLNVSLFSFYSTWDLIKKIPYISNIFKHLLKNQTTQQIQMIFEITIVGIIIISIISISQFSIEFSVLGLLILSFVFIVFFGICYITPIFQYLDGLKVLFSERKRKKDLNSIHDAIIICHYKTQLKILPYGDGIQWLVKYFQSNNRLYFQYNCYDKDEFKNVVSNPKARSLWIFGHGTRSMLNFGTGFIQPYSELKDSPKKLFVGQFHCNGFEDPSEKSLADLISNYGYVTDGIMTTGEIRQAIKIFVNIRINENNQFHE